MNEKEARADLEEMGFTVKSILGEDGRYALFVEDQIVWSKMFVFIKQHGGKELLDSIPHLKWMENIILKYNPRMQSMMLEGKPAYGVVFQPIVDKVKAGRPVKRVDRYIGYIFYLALEGCLKSVMDKLDW